MIYLIDKETNEILRAFDSVIIWDNNSIEYWNGGYRAKTYCSENQYFTDVVPTKE